MTGLTGQQQFNLLLATTMLEEDAHTVRAAIAFIQDAGGKMQRGGIQLPGQPDPRAVAQGELNAAMQMLNAAMPRLIDTCGNVLAMMGQGRPQAEAPADKPKIQLAE